MTPFPARRRAAYNESAGINATLMGASDMPATEDELKKALKAFKKRLKLTRLDDDSKIGHGPMSSGSSSKVVSMQPPAGFGREIWEELADKGYLRRDGIGFYELVEGNK
jgi:hypothetical protein